MDFTKLDGLIPAVVQDETSNEVLMVGFMNEEAWRLTRERGFVTFYSRTRQTLWMKGETSGNRLLVRQVMLDCDDDTLLIKVRREGDGQRLPPQPGVVFRAVPRKRRSGRTPMKLRLGIPKGSLQNATIDLFRRAGFNIPPVDRAPTFPASTIPKSSAC